MTFYKNQTKVNTDNTQLFHWQLSNYVWEGPHIYSLKTVVPCFQAVSAVPFTGLWRSVSAAGVQETLAHIVST